MTTSMTEGGDRTSSPDVRVSSKNLIRMSVPLMLTAASEAVMMFMDRVFLARYDLAAMNAAVATFLSSAVPISLIVALCGVAEVLAGQYNGQGAKKEVARPVWQLIWLALASMVFTVPVALTARDFVLGPELASASGLYFTLVFGLAPVWGINVALAGFFAATGRPKIVTVAAFAANLLNVVLDYVLIFGAGPIPSMGIDGAAIATVSAQLLQGSVLLLLFLSPREHRVFATRRLRWHRGDLSRAFRIGLPHAASHGTEVAAWAVLYRMLASTSAGHLTVLAVSQSMMTLFAFVTEGLKQGVVALASNALGAGRFDDVDRLISIAKRLLVGLMGLLAIPLLLRPELSLMLLGDPVTDPEILWQVHLGIRLLWVFMVFDGMVWVYHGVLGAGGDTRIPMVINIATVWFLALLPAYVMVAHWGMAPWTAALGPALYALGNCWGHSLRFARGHWRVSMAAKSE